MKRIVTLLKKRRHGGFTLVEMIVSIALLAILLGGMVLFISPLMSSFNSTQTNLVAENVSTAVNEYITKSIRYANQVVVFTDTNYTRIVTYKAMVEAMVDELDTLNSDPTNKTYELKCISLKPDTDGMFYLYEETVSQDTGTIDLTKSRKVFSDSVYNGLFLDVEMAVPNDLTPDDAGNVDPTKLRDDTLSVTVRTYTDQAKTNLVFAGLGYIELHQIKFMLERGGKAEDYYVKLQPVAPDTEDGIYIYYIVRRRGQPISP